MEQIRVTLVTTQGCHFCDDAEEILAHLSQTFPLSIDLVPLASETGRNLLVEHRVPYPPIVLVDGSFFGYGRLSRRRLEQRLAELDSCAEMS